LPKEINVTNRLPEIANSGPPAGRGFQHGQQLKERVAKTVEFYTRVRKNQN
jgi:hypothetical protein